MKREAWAYAIIAAIVSAYVIARAICVPVIHDEARTFQMFVASGEFLPYHAECVAGNHLLVTAPAQLSYRIFGPGLFALRLWSVLSFLLYACYTWKLGAAITSRLVRWCFWLALLCTPFFIEFFSLFRGYGPAMAFLLMAVHHGVRFAERDGTRDLVVSLAAITLAAAGSLSLLLMWCAMLSGSALLVIVRKSGTSRRILRLVAVLANAAMLVFAARYSAHLSDAGAFYFGLPDGLFHGTLPSLTQFILGSSHTIVLVSVALLIAIGFFFALRNWRAPLVDVRNASMTVSAVLLFSDLLGRVVLGEAFGVLYPTDRTAMQCVPLFLLLVALVIDGLAVKRGWIAYGAMVLLVLPIRTIVTANVDHTMYWSEQAIPDAFYRIAEARQGSLARPLMIGAYHQMPSCWRFGNLVRGIAANELDPEGFPQPTCDLLMIDTNFKPPPPGFRTIARAATGSNNLMERVVPLKTRVVLDSNNVFASTDAEYIDLWKPPTASFSGREALVEWSAGLKSEGRVSAVLVLEVSDPQGMHLLYNKLTGWVTEPFTWRCACPRSPFRRRASPSISTTRSAAACSSIDRICAYTSSIPEHSHICPTSDPTPSEAEGSTFTPDALRQEPDGPAHRAGIEGRLVREPRHRHPDAGGQLHPQQHQRHAAKRERDPGHGPLPLGG